MKVICFVERRKSFKILLKANKIYLYDFKSCNTNIKRNTILLVCGLFIGIYFHFSILRYFFLQCAILRHFTSIEIPKLYLILLFMKKYCRFFWVSRLLLLHLLLFYYNLNTICACLLLFPFCYNNYFIFVMILLLVQIVVFFSLRSFIRFIDSSFIYAVTFFRPT